jgi:hypothetical protein
VIRGDIAGALNIVLEYPPYGPNVEEAKVLVLTAVLDIFNADGRCLCLEELESAISRIDPQ